MEFLGHFTEVKTNNKKRAIDLFYPTVELFCDATSKLIEGFKEECKFVVANEEGELYIFFFLSSCFICTALNIFSCKHVVSNFQSAIPPGAFWMWFSLFMRQQAFPFAPFQISL